jgi:hypothetical protein
MSRWRVSSIAILLVAGTAFAQTPAEPALRSGGVGSESREEMQAVADQYSLHVTLATRSGSFLSDVRVEIRDAAGEAVVETVTEGPLLFVDLPPGDYTVAAMRADGPSGTVRAKIPASGPPTKVVLRIGETESDTTP